jgi:anti-sigma-K factor RskA
MSELDYMDALAAEYVLGTLDAEERARARTLLEADETFAAKVELWERRFGDLYLMVEPVEPDSGVWARIKAKMLEVEQRVRTTEQPMPPPPLPTTAEPPSLDAIEAVISETATTLTSEATSAAATLQSEAPTPEVMPTTVSEAIPGPEATLAPPSESTPVPISEAPLPLDATRTSAVEAMPTPPVAVAPAVASPQAVGETQAQAVEPALLRVRRQLGRWRAFAILMTLVVVAVAALLAAWRFAPDRVPPMLQPLELMRQAGVPLPAMPAPRRPAPPESRFDE